MPRRKAKDIFADKREAEILARATSPTVTTNEVQLELLFVELADKIKTLHDKAMAAAMLSIDFAIHAGEELTRVKQDLPHGYWTNWITFHLPNLQIRTVQRYMRAYKRRNDALAKEDPNRFMAEIWGHQNDETENIITALPSPANEVNTNPAEQAKTIGDADTNKNDPPSVSKLPNKWTPKPTNKDPVDSEDKPDMDRRSRPQRWASACADAPEVLEELGELQAAYQEWLDILHSESATTKMLKRDCRS